MAIAILIITIVLCIILEGFFSYKQYWWAADIGDNTPFGLWISFMVASGVVMVISIALLIIKLVQ